MIKLGLAVVNEGILQLSLNADPQFEEPPKESYCEQIIMEHLGLRLIPARITNPLPTAFSPDAKARY